MKDKLLTDKQSAVESIHDCQSMQGSCVESSNWQHLNVQTYTGSKQDKQILHHVQVFQQTPSQQLKQVACGHVI